VNGCPWPWETRSVYHYTARTGKHTGFSPSTSGQNTESRPRAKAEPSTNGNGDRKSRTTTGWTVWSGALLPARWKAQVLPALKLQVRHAGATIFFGGGFRVPKTVWLNLFTPVRSSSSFVESSTGLGATLKQPDSRELSSFFGAIFSGVTQFDVRPVGWYNRRMEFLGKDRYRQIGASDVV